MLEIRSAKPKDYPALADVFFQAVRQGARDAYSEEEVAAWCPEVPSDPAWSRRLEGTDILLAEAAGTVQGFMSLAVHSGYLDMAFVRPTRQRKGVASALYSVLEGRARAAGLARLETEASLLAEPFFQSFGWQVTRRQEVLRRGVTLQNARMEKQLD